jgi:Protein of unknown function (DUF2442)
MITSVADERIKDVHVTNDELVVALVDGRTLSVPLVWYPRLLNASAEQRNDWQLIGDGEPHRGGLLQGKNAVEEGRCSHEGSHEGGPGRSHG